MGTKFKTMVGQDHLNFPVINTHSEYEVSIKVFLDIFRLNCNAMLVSISYVTNYNMSVTLVSICYLKYTFSKFKRRS